MNASRFGLGPNAEALHKSLCARRKAVAEDPTILAPFFERKSQVSSQFTLGDTSIKGFISFYEAAGVEHYTYLWTNVLGWPLLRSQCPVEKEEAYRLFHSQNSKAALKELQKWRCSYVAELKDKPVPISQDAVDALTIPASFEIPMYLPYFKGRDRIQKPLFQAELSPLWTYQMASSWNYEVCLSCRQPMLLNQKQSESKRSTLGLRTCYRCTDDEANQLIPYLSTEFRALLGRDTYYPMEMVTREIKLLDQCRAPIVDRSQDHILGSLFRDNIFPSFDVESNLTRYCILVQRASTMTDKPRQSQYEKLLKFMYNYPEFSNNIPCIYWGDFHCSGSLTHDIWVQATNSVDVMNVYQLFIQIIHILGSSKNARVSLVMACAESLPTGIFKSWINFFELLSQFLKPDVFERLEFVGYGTFVAAEKGVLRIPFIVKGNEFLAALKSYTEYEGSNANTRLFVNSLGEGVRRRLEGDIQPGRTHLLENTGQYNSGNKPMHFIGHGNGWKGLL
ncbi:hypothetical protein BCR33DRAFT_741529 [Rhizoclosmatium globosum]|uniref:Uncharacterized protein n=1 Tax=Rhizoclosmatium globosum TaxID=329046 RepID=A0A1Y2BV99_9FUNG|nr:hypothetical protein BCR33DRAFT_741529 [Rhizoclosmatium globosum]|eukprot:ORY38689.1 hypothetical protein BCR33DRAFT_741529 [Rhizoclosmatium globosum]